MKLPVLCVCLALLPCLSLSRPDPLHTRAFTAEKSGDVGDIWKDCSKSGDIAKINSVTITPDPPKKGGPFKISANITTSATISGGEIEIKVKYGIIPAVDQKEDLCTVLKDASLACPLAAGTYTTTQNVTIPSVAPGGHYTGSVVAHNSEGEISCVDLDFHL